MRRAALTHATGPRPERLLLAAGRERLGGFADALALGQNVASQATRAVTEWAPRVPAPAPALQQEA